MRCECCDAELSDSEATSKFVGTPGQSARYVNMCKRCQREAFGGTDVQIVTRRDLENKRDPAEPILRDPFDLGDFGVDWDEV